jgi:hypothetical protein
MRIAIVTLSCAVLINLGGGALGALIDFETTPASLPPTDDLLLPISNPYIMPGLSITFGFDLDSNGTVESDAVFEHAGLDPFEPPNGGFAGSFGTDTADPGFTAQLGNWFLRSPIPGGDFGNFVIQYSSSFPVTAASGEIWDIDGTQAGLTEQYTVQAYDSSNNLLATIVSPTGTLDSSIAPLDGQPWVFAFSGLTAGIDRIVIDFTGTKPAGIGLAFNNFNPTAVPEPGALLIATLTFVGGVALTRQPS